MLARHPSAVPAALVAVVVALGSARLVTGACGSYHDDGIYVATAKALAEGRGYRLINLPGEPAQTKYSFLFPTALACLWWLWPTFPHNLAALQGLSLLSGAMAVAIGFVYLSRHEYATRPQCVVAAALCATSPTFLYFATLALSEALFTLLFMLSILAVDTTNHSTTSQKIGLGVLSALPFLTRPVGVCIPPAMGFALWFRSRSFMVSMVAASVTASTWILWVGFNTWSSGGNPSVYAYYTADNYRTWWLSGSAVQVPLRNLLWMTIHSVTVVVPVLTSLTTTFAWPLLIAAGILVWIDAYKRFRRSVLGPIMLSYVAIILIWPWPPERFLIPLMPILSICLVGAVVNLSGRLPVKATRVVFVLTATMMIGANLVQHVMLVHRVRTTGYPFRNMNHPLVHWADYEQLFAWLRSNTAPDAVVASGLDSMVYLYAERRGFRPFVQRPVAMFYTRDDTPLGPVEEFAATLRNAGPDFLVELPMPGFFEEAPLSRLIHETKSALPECLVVVYADANDPRFVVYSVNVPLCRVRQSTF